MYTPYVHVYTYGDVSRVQRCSDLSRTRQTLSFCVFRKNRPSSKAISTRNWKIAREDSFVIFENGCFPLRARCFSGRSYYFSISISWLLVRDETRHGFKQHTFYRRQLSHFYLSRTRARTKQVTGAMRKQFRAIFSFILSRAQSRSERKQTMPIGNCLVGANCKLHREDSGAAGRRERRVRQATWAPSPPSRFSMYVVGY